MAERWKIFALLAAIFTVGFFYRVCMAVVSRDLVVELGLSAAELGAVSGIFFYAFALMQLPLGPLIDRFGGRIIISWCGVVTLCGSLLFSLAGGYLSALTARALLGCGTACILMGSLSIIAHRFPAGQFTRVSGYLIGTANLGSICATGPLARAITCFGWRHVFLGVTALQLLATVAVFRYLPDCASGRRERSLSAEPAPVISRQELLLAWKSLVSCRDFWLVSLIAYFWYANYMALLSLWGGPYLREVAGLSRYSAGSVLLCISLGYVVGSLLVGKVIDWHAGSLEKTIVRGQGALALLMLVMLGPGERLPVLLLGAIFFLIGLVSASGPIIYPLARNLVHHSYGATAMTGVNFFLLLGAASMQHLMGEVIGSFPRAGAGHPAAAYHAAFAIPLAGLLLTLLLFRILKGGARVTASESVAQNA